MKTKTTICNERYLNNHGRSRMPSERGSWAFHPNFNVDALSAEVLWVNGTWGEAKKAARAHFSALGVAYVQALS